MPTLKEFLTAFLGKTLNMPEEKVAELLNSEGTEVKPEALETLLTADATRVKLFKDENQKFFDNGLKKATKEVMTDFEKKVKEKYGITSEKIGDELIEEIVLSKAGKPAGNIDEAKVKAHPLYIELQDKMTKAITAKETEWKEKYDGFEKTVAKEKTFSEVLTKAETVLKKFDLPKDDKLKEAQKTFLITEIGKFNFQKNNDDFVVLDADGKVMEDGHGNRTTFDTFIANAAAKYWPKIEGQPRSGTGATNDPGGTGAQGTEWKGKIPANDDEYAAMIAGEGDATKRVQITEAYDKSRAGTN